MNRKRVPSNQVTPTRDARPASDARLDHRACYQAISRRDRRFDGTFYTGVTTTGIFCRPSCPARTPASRNVRFFAHAAGAIDAGFRPCRRCRPELAPAHPEWNRRADLAHRAMALIEQGVVDREGVGGLASRLGVSERHLRRELVSEVGTGPNQLARTRRVLLARRLLDETSLAVTDIAFASGFTSIRQFNESFRQAFDATPTELRRRPGRSPTPGDRDSVVTLTLASRGRLGWENLHTFFATHVIPGLETAENGRFRRHLPAGWVELAGGPEDRSVVITCSLDDLSELTSLIPTIRLLCDLDSDVDAIGRELAAHPDLAALLLHDGEPIAVPRLPGAFDRFELAIRAVVGQQISLASAHTMLGKLLDIVNPGTDTHSRFPTPAELLASPLDELGMVSRRRETIRTVAQAVEEGRVNLSVEADPLQTEHELLALPGIGPWTAGYITMRAFGHPDGWPSSDLVLARRLGLSARDLDARAEAWRPWRAYGAMTIWTSPPPRTRRSTTPPSP